MAQFTRSAAYKLKDHTSFLKTVDKTLPPMRVIGTMMSLPSMAAFYISWTISSLVRPIFLVSIGLIIASGPTSAVKKFKMLASTIQYMVLCKDKKWNKPEHDPDSYFNKATEKQKKSIQRKTVIFLRHGESTWNDTFNQGDRSTVGFCLYFIPNLVKAFATEWFFAVTGQENESWFYDSPLSEKGLQQAISVKKYLATDIEFSPPKEAAILRILVGDKKVTSQMVSSNLRRAIATMTIGFQDRLNKNYPNDDIIILPELQEVSFNPDALCITPAYEKVKPSFMEPKDIIPLYTTRIDVRKHHGNKPVTTNGLKRMTAFTKIIFDDIDKEAVIATGHSLYFKAFFQTFLPYSFDHVAKKKKLINCGMVSFTFERILVDEKNKLWAHRIVPNSIVTLHGGF